MQSIQKAVIPVAGLGTRMLPATKAIPKEMLPVVDKPLIQYVVQEAVAAGIKEIVLVTHASKNAIENHFDTSFELEAQLENRLKRQLLEDVRSIVPEDVTVISVRQPEAKGLGHAILCAKPVVGHYPFAVLLPDVLIDPYKSNLAVHNLAAMVQNFTTTGNSQIMVGPVPWDSVDQYGVVDCQGADLTSGGTTRVHSVVEKPNVDAAPSNMAVIGRYILPSSVWQFLAGTVPGAGGEIQLTDAIDQLLEDEMVDAYQLVGATYDCGNKFGYMQANIEYGLRHPLIGEQLKAYLAQSQNTDTKG